MNLSIIVMISTLALPSGDTAVNVKTFASAASCIEAADIEVTDPFVRAVECAELQDGVLTLRFGKDEAQPGADAASERPAS